MSYGYPPQGGYPQGGYPQGGYPPAQYPQNYPPPQQGYHPQPPGPPQGHAPYSQQPQYPQPPYQQPLQQYTPQQYNQSQTPQPYTAPPPPAQYQQNYPPPPPPPQNYPPPQQYPPQNYALHHQPPPQSYSQGPYPLQHQQSYPPPPVQQSSWSAQGAPQGYAPPLQNFYAPSPTPTFVDPSADINTIYRACKGFGTDEQALISVLAYRDGHAINAIRTQYPTRTRRDLLETLRKETSGHFQTALVACAMGPTESEAFFAHMAVAGVGTNESILTEAIMGRSNVEIAEMKRVYKTRYGETLENAIKGDLSGKTERMFLLALEERKVEENIPTNPQAVANDVRALYNATQGRLGTDEMLVCRIFVHSNTMHLCALAAEYKNTYNTDIVKMLRREFSGHMLEALVYIIEGAIDKPKRDAKLLEESMKGFGTKDELLISRLVRAHWDRGHLERVKAAYRSLYRRDLAGRVRGETSGDYGRMMVALVG